MHRFRPNINIHARSIHDYPAKSIQAAGIMLMIDNIKKALERLINRSEWMDGATKKRAIEKSDMIGSMVGFSETMTDLV